MTIAISTTLCIAGHLELDCRNTMKVGDPSKAAIVDVSSTSSESSDEGEEDLGLMMMMCILTYIINN